MDDTGAAWVGDGSLETAKGKGKGKGKGSGSDGWTLDSIIEFKENADFVFDEGSVP
ncbi:MAG: hypothetical protein JKY60_19230, partial [Kordiimonadaceae bacterium]|nr:hypothetical protein [Kordiimonadaceae bacterium]